MLLGNKAKFTNETFFDKSITQDAHVNMDIGFTIWPSIWLFFGLQICFDDFNNIAMQLPSFLFWVEPSITKCKKPFGHLYSSHLLLPFQNEFPKFWNNNDYGICIM